LSRILVERPRETLKNSVEPYRAKLDKIFIKINPAY